MPSIKIQFFTPKPWLVPGQEVYLRYSLREELVAAVNLEGGNLEYSFTEAYFVDCVSFDVQRAYDAGDNGKVERLLETQNTDDVRIHVIFTQKDKEPVIPDDQDVREKIKDALNACIVKSIAFHEGVTRSTWVEPMYGAAFGVAK